MKYPQERIDAYLLQIGKESYHGIGPFQFVVPSELQSPGDRRSTDPTPGIYLRAWGSNSGGPGMYGYRKTLSQDQARELADLLDSYDALSFRCDGKDMSDWPHTYRELVDGFYRALGRGLTDAIDQVADRGAMLREVRAAITGEVEPKPWC